MRNKSEQQRGYFLDDDSEGRGQARNWFWIMIKNIAWEGSNDIQEIMIFVEIFHDWLFRSFPSELILIFEWCEVNLWEKTEN